MTTNSFPGEKCGARAYKTKTLPFDDFFFIYWSKKQHTMYKLLIVNILIVSGKKLSYDVNKKEMDRG